VRLSFPPLGTLVLDCRDALGRVPESIDVVVEREGARGNRHGLTAEDGRFRMPVSQGSVKVSVEARGYRTADVPVHVVGDAVNEATVPLGHPLPILDVRVVDPSGAPVPGVTVTIREQCDPPARRDQPASIRAEFDAFLALNAVTAVRAPSERTSLDGWARFTPDIAAAQAFGVSIPRDGDAEPRERPVRVPVTGRVTTTFVVVPRPRVRTWTVDERFRSDALLPEPPAGLLVGDLLFAWDGSPIRLVEEVPWRWTEPVAVGVLRDGEEIEVTLPPMTRTFQLDQALLPPPAR
jgi:hypothetical protein